MSKTINCDKHGETEAVCINYVLFRYVCAKCKLEADKEKESVR